MQRPIYAPLGLEAVILGKHGKQYIAFEGEKKTQQLNVEMIYTEDCVPKVTTYPSDANKGKLDV